MEQRSTLELLENTLLAFSTGCRQEEVDKCLMLDFLRSHQNALLRENLSGHFTASAWVISPACNEALMVFHKIYQAWSWPGGHADGEHDLFSVAKREVQEETGISALTPLLPHPFSLEIIGVQPHERRGEFVPAHLHYNLSYLFLADPMLPLQIAPNENSAVAWRSFTEILDDHTEPHMHAIYKKLISRM